MPASSSPTWIQAATRRRASYGNLRISDAERTEVADLLSQHYGDGRLDQAEFNDRLDQAMKAKTYSDLSGLFADLPRTGAVEGAAPERHERPQHRILILILIVAITATVGEALVRSYIPWLLIGLLALLWWRYGPWPHRPR